MSKTGLLKIAKPIMMNTEMARAVNEGRKKQTMRLIDTLLIPNTKGFDKVSIKNINPETDLFQLYTTTHTERSKDGLFGGSISAYNNGGLSKRTEQYVKPKYKIGDVLWVREPARIEFTFVRDGIDMMDYRYLADDGGTHRAEIPKKHLLKMWMDNKKCVPNGCIKEMARIFLEVTDVRVERLQDISHVRIEEEGSPNYANMLEVTMLTREEKDNNIKWWQTLWNSTSKDGYKWEDNPYVFVYEFEMLVSKSPSQNETNKASDSQYLLEVFG